MPNIQSNVQVAEDIYLLTVEGHFQGRMGQFYMLRAWSDFPLLSRPISIYDIGEGYIQFLYRAVGEGTNRLADRKAGETVQLEGPFGNGFPEVTGRVALVGGGIGIAPLFFVSKQVHHADIFLGFSREAFQAEAFRPYARNLTLQVGGFIVDEIDVTRYDAILACGPHPMMKALAEKAEGSGVEVWISLEKRMACGVGACLVCSIMCHGGNKKACQDGPVFAAQEVNFDAEHGL